MSVFFEYVFYNFFLPMIILVFGILDFLIVLQIAFYTGNFYTILTGSWLFYFMIPHIYVLILHILLALQTIRYYLFPFFQISKKTNEICAICLESGTMISLYCNHVFHWDCISKWMDNCQHGSSDWNFSCPICKKKF